MVVLEGAISKSITDEDYELVGGVSYTVKKLLDKEWESYTVHSL